jgi:hypothetical protein
MAGYSGKPLSQKLGIKPGFRIFADSSPKAYGDIVGELPEGATVVTRAAGSLDMVHLFATEARGLAGKLKRLRGRIAPDGMIWVSWPKQASGVATDLSDVVVRDTALPLGLVDVKVLRGRRGLVGIEVRDSKGPAQQALTRDRSARRELVPGD